jgi:7-dehydrocholesterol reductase
MTVVQGGNMKNGPSVADWSSGKGVLPGRAVLGPLLLMMTTPCFSIIFFHVCTEMHGDFLAFAQLCWYETRTNGGMIVSVLRDIWPDPWDVDVWKMIVSFMAFQLALMKLVPGKRFEATITPQGNRPVYTANGVACYVITLATLLLLAHCNLFDPATVYDKFGNILSSMNVFAMCFCVMLLVKGYVAPSSSDSGTTGNIVQDFFWVRTIVQIFFLVLGCTFYNAEICTYLSVTFSLYSTPFCPLIPWMLFFGF